MTLGEKLDQLDSVFIDTAPVIYYIEAHPVFGPLAKQVVERFTGGEIRAISSVVTLAEVLPRPARTRR